MGVTIDQDRVSLAAVAAGDETGLRELLDRHGAALCGYLAGLVGDGLLAEEILQLAI